MSYCKENGDYEKKSYAIDVLIQMDGGPEFLVEVLSKGNKDKNIMSKVAAELSNLSVDKAPIESIMNLLKTHDAYIRNLAITILQSYGEAIRYYIVKFLIGDDPDLRIFAVNVLGDVGFKESRDMLVELLQTETHINVAMTAVDYLAEIGEIEDIPLLEKVKDRFDGDVYAQFGIDNAISMIKG